jgi:tRNA nucleotidyltransferase (CCA-adding enzyme)
MTFSYLADSNLTTRLLQALTPEQGRLLRSVAEEADRQRLPLYIVGGFVRDLLLGHPGLDFDLVVEGDAITFARSLSKKYGGRITSHTRFGTAVWYLEGTKLASSQNFDGEPDNVKPANMQTLDLISARSETYAHPGALPKVKPGMLADDLQRRDFTINTLALRLDGEHFGELRDDLGGLEDLQAGLIRVLHHGSFADDPTRLFRAVRYEQRYGFRITPETLALIPDACLLIKVLSAERVRHELDLVLEEENAASMMERLAELGCLAAVQPTLEWKHATQTRFVKGMAAAQTLEHAPSRRTLGWTLWLMDVPLPGLESIEKRLHFESGLRNILMAASALFAEVNSLAGKKPSRCVAVLDEIPLKAVQAVFLALPAGPVRQGLSNYLETWRHIRPKTTGHDLKKRNLPPGPAYQSILRRLREAWLDGEVKTVDEEMALLDKLIKKYRPE